MIDSIFISSFIAWSLNLPLRLPHQSQILSDLISLDLALIFFILADEFHQPLVLFRLLYVNIKLPLNHLGFTTGALLIPALLNLLLQTSFASPGSFELVSGLPLNPLNSCELNFS